MEKKKIVILSGPGGVGKGPLRKALRRYHSEIHYQELVLCTSRQPRPDEIDGKDYHFLSINKLRRLDRNRFIISHVSTDIQSIDTEQIKKLLKTDDLILAELYYSFTPLLKAWLSRQTNWDVEIKSIALLPLSNEEIEEKKQGGKTTEEIVYQLVKEKLLRRGQDSQERIDARSKDAYKTIQSIADYDYKIINHAGEDNIGEWSDPLGPEAKRILEEFVAIIKTISNNIVKSD